MSKRFVIADPHFGDKNIIKFESRPFKNVEEMDEELIRRWNEIVSLDDDIFVIGDFIPSLDINYTTRIIKALNGKITLIKGNHDRNLELLKELGVTVYEYPILVDSFWIMSHEPLYMTTNAPYANIFGHIHNNPLYKTVSERGYCVSVERINYYPILLDTVKSRVLELC